MIYLREKLNWFLVCGATSRFKTAECEWNLETFRYIYSAKPVSNLIAVCVCVCTILFFNELKWYVCHGMTESVKVHRKDQSVKDFTSKCLFLLFWPISCISLIFLIEIWSFCTNLLENYPSHKIDQLPLLRILSLCMDHSMQTRINSLYLFLLFLFTPLALFGQNDVRIHVLVCTIVYSVLDQA